MHTQCTYIDYPICTSIHVKYIYTNALYIPPDIRTYMCNIHILHAYAYIYRHVWQLRLQKTLQSNTHWNLPLLNDNIKRKPQQNYNRQQQFLFTLHLPMYNSNWTISCWNTTMCMCRAPSTEAEQMTKSY